MSDYGNLSEALDAPPVFVVGVHRSGTTWVYDMISAHPRVAGVFESGLFSVDLGLAPVFHPAHWYQDARALDADQEFFGAHFRLNQLVGRSEALTDVRRMASGWLTRAMGEGHCYLVEKTPQHLFTMPLIAELFPGASFVHVVRDGRDVAMSAKAASADWPRGRVKGFSVRQTAAKWKTAVERAREMSSMQSLRYLEVRFEDIKQDPVASLAKVYSFCQIPASSELVEASVADASIDSKRRDRADAFRREGTAGGWRQAMRLRERIEFDRAAGDLLVALDYAHDRLWWMPGRRA